MASGVSASLEEFQGVQGSDVEDERAAGLEDAAVRARAPDGVFLSPCAGRDGGVV